MRLLEYQGKEVFARFGIPVPASRVVCTAGAAHVPGDGHAPGETTEIETVCRRVVAAVEELCAATDGTSTRGGEAAANGEAGGGVSDLPVAIKAQVMMGGRGKAGLIKVVKRDAAAAACREMMAAAAAADVTVPAVLVERGVAVERELYLSVTADAAAGRFIVLASSQGGVEIETLAQDQPDAVKRLSVDPFRGLQPFQARGLAYDLDLPAAQVGAFARIVGELYRLFGENDAELAEINPLFLTTTGEFIAGDAKLMIDDNSLPRQPDYTLAREQFDSDAAYEAALEGIPYVQFDGEISLMCAGAGLTTTVFDLVNMEGGTVANYLEFGGPNYRKAGRAMELCLKNQSSVILIVTFGTIARADVMAAGVVEAMNALKPDRPVVACIRGTNEEEAQRTLRAAGLDPLTDTEEAVRRAIHLAKEARS